MKSKKVLFLARFYYPHIGGVEKHVYWISKCIRREGYKVLVLTEKHKSNLSSSGYKDGVRIVRFVYSHVKVIGLLNIWYFLFRNRKLIKESDIVHCHDVFIWYLPFKFIFPHIPVYTTFHGWEGKFPVPLRNVLIRKIAKALSLKCLGIGKYIEKYYGVSLDSISYGAVLPVKIRKVKRKKLLIYVGRIDNDTGASVLFKSLSLMDRFPVVFFGDGALRGIAKKYGKVTGYIKKVPYQDALICYASGYLTALEAMAAKCLVITSYDNKLREDCWKLSPMSKWMIIEKNPERIAERICYFLNRPKEAENKIEGAYKWVQAQTWEKLANQYVKLWGLKD